MTTSVRTFRSPKPHEIDVRCSAALPQPDSSRGRCQLFAGHDGPHAIMFGRCGERTVRTWRSSNPAAAVDTCADAVQQRPWMFGFPAPAWFETESPPASAD